MIHEEQTQSLPSSAQVQTPSATPSATPPYPATCYSADPTKPMDKSIPFCYTKPDEKGLFEAYVDEHLVQKGNDPGLYQLADEFDYQFQAREWIDPSGYLTKKTLEDLCCIKETDKRRALMKKFIMDSWTKLFCSQTPE